MRTLYVDTETSGVVQGPGGLVEIAVVDENGTVLFERLVNPMHPINPFCVRIHGITDEMVAQAPTWDEIRPELTALFDGSHFVAHNVTFDRLVVGEAGAGILETTCTVELCRRKLGYPLKLALAAERASHVAVGPWHRAAADALACRSVHVWLNGLPDLSPEERRAFQAARRREKSAMKAALKAIDPRLAKVREQKCPTPLRHGQPWTAELDARLAQMWREGREMIDILELFLRTPRSIFARLEHLNLIPPEHNPYGSRPG
jgi:DNA polymerase-3 subunit epsilon